MHWICEKARQHKPAILLCLSRALETQSHIPMTTACLPQQKEERKRGPTAKGQEPQRSRGNGEPTPRKARHPGLMMGPHTSTLIHISPPPLKQGQMIFSTFCSVSSCIILKNDVIITKPSFYRWNEKNVPSLSVHLHSVEEITSVSPGL